MLSHLHHLITSEYPDIVPGELSLRTGLNRVSWWKGGADDPLQDLYDLLRYLTAGRAAEIVYPLARQSQLNDLSMMGYAMMTARSVEDFVLIAGYALDQFNFPMDITWVDEGDGNSGMLFSPKLDHENYFDGFLELSMAMAWHYIEVVLPPETKAAPLSVSYTFQLDSARKKVARNFYNCDVFSGAERNIVTMPTSLLKTKLSIGNLSDIVACSLQCNQILSSTQTRGVFHKKVERALIEAPSICKFSFTETAKYLNVKERQLKSHLDKENASFRKIALQVRMQLAQEYLNSTTFPVKQIAYLLSYQEPNNFIRAFTNYVGISPRRFRNQ